MKTTKINNKKQLVLKDLLGMATGCGIQHDGWPCGTCFFTADDKFNNRDWQTVLFYRGDTKREDLDNLPENIEKGVDKIISTLINN